jgi:hypothetical protein
VEFIYFGISYNNPYSPLPAPGSRASLIPPALRNYTYHFAL